MAKHTRKAPVKGPKPITDFFSRVPASSQASVGSAAASSEPCPKGERETASLRPQPAISLKGSSEKALKNSSATNYRSQDLSPLSSLPKKPTHLLHQKNPPFLRTISLKRARSPDPAKLTMKDRVNTETQVVRSAPRKKTRLSSPFSVSQHSSSSLIPSSQSDEEELPTPVSDRKVEESVKDWRKLALPHGFGPMDVDVDLTPCNYSCPSTPELKVPATASRHLLTPPYTHVLSEVVIHAPPTPIALNAEAKAAKIIEDIRARALQKVQSSPEFNTSDIPDVLEDSDDDDVLAQGLFVAPDCSLNFSSVANADQLRRSSRQRPFMSASSTGSPISPRSRSLPAQPVSSDEEDRPAPVRIRARPNPITSLLKEKKNAEKSGRGSDAFLKAETNLFGKSFLLEEMNLEDGDDNELDYDNLKNQDSLFSLPFKAVNDNVFLGEEDEKELAERKIDRHKVNAILKDDRLAREEEESARKREGVRLWVSSAPSEDRMAVDEQPGGIPEFSSAGSSVTLQFLHQAMRKRDFGRATMLLKSGALVNLSAADQPNILSDLCLLATSSNLHGSPVNDAAFYVALDLLSGSSTHGMRCNVPAAFVFRSLLELGAPAEQLKYAGLKIDFIHCSNQVADTTRESIFYRVTALITQAASARRLVPHEIPDVIVALALVAMDPSTSHDLWRDIMITVNHVCRSSSPVHSSDREAESKIAARLVALSEKYEPANKAALVSILAGGTGATMRIARFIAYSMILQYPSSSVTPKSYCNPAPLAPLLDQLVQPPKNGEDEQLETVFSINDDTDYTAMKHYVYLFGVSTTNIKAYVDLEKQTAKAKSRPLGPRPRVSQEASKVVSNLDLLHSLLESLHGSINDLRAAHLDRSRTKAVVKQLQMRIYYQRCAFERAWKDQNNPSILMKNWLAVKPKASS